MLILFLVCRCYQSSVDCFSFYIEILAAFRNATQYANKWARAWHTWALFNTAVMSLYTVRGYASVASQFVVAAVTGYFHSIACSANTKGVDDSLQVNSIPLLSLTCNMNVILVLPVQPEPDLSIWHIMFSLSLYCIRRAELFHLIFII